MSSRPMKRLSTQKFIASKKKKKKKLPNSTFNIRRKMRVTEIFRHKLKSYHEQIQFSTGSSRKWKCQLLNYVQPFVTPWIVAHQTPLSVGFSRKEQWSGLPFPSAGDIPNSGTDPWCPALQTDSLLSKPQGKTMAILWDRLFRQMQFSN